MPSPQAIVLRALFVLFCSLVLLGCSDDESGVGEDAIDVTVSLGDGDADTDDDTDDDPPFSGLCHDRKHLPPCFGEIIACLGDDVVLVCEIDPQMRCLRVTEENCNDFGSFCDPTLDPPACTGSNPACVGLPNLCSHRESTCRGTELLFCQQDANGCLLQDVFDCASVPGSTCEDSDQGASCVDP